MDDQYSSEENEITWEFFPNASNSVGNNPICQGCRKSIGKTTARVCTYYYFKSANMKKPRKTAKYCHAELDCIKLGGFEDDNELHVNIPLNADQMSIYKRLVNHL